MEVSPSGSSSTISTENDSNQPSNSTSSNCNLNHDYPDIWTLAPKNKFCEKCDWMCFKDLKLSCKVCPKVPTSADISNRNGVPVSKEWPNCEITSNTKTTITFFEKKYSSTQRQ